VIVCCDDDDLKIAEIALHAPGRGRLREWPARWTKEVPMAEELTPRPPGRVPRPFEKDRSGNPPAAGPVRNKRTLAASTLLAGESEALTRKAVELALVGDPTAMRLCLERILPPCREGRVEFAPPPIESAADVAAAMKAFTSALVGGMVTLGEAATIAAVVDTFVRAIETSDFDRRLQLVEASYSKQRGPQPACTAAPGRLGTSTHRRDFAADSLQVQQRGIVDAIRDCSDPPARGGVEDVSKSAYTAAFLNRIAVGQSR
jgi:hypothetical protein